MRRRPRPTPNPEAMRSARRIASLLCLALAAVLLLISVPKIIADLNGKAAFDRDPSCALLPAPGAPPGDCRIVEATVDDEGITVYHGTKGSETDTPYVVLNLPDGSHPQVDVPQEIYDAADPTSQEKLPVQLFRGEPVRITIGDLTRETGDSPMERIKVHFMGPIVGTLLLGLGVFGLYWSRKRPDPTVKWSA